MHWAQVKDAYDKGVFHLPGQHKNQQDTSLHEEFNITPCLKSPVENSEETSDKNNMSLAICKRQAWNEVPLFREPNRFTLPPLRSLSAGNRRTPLQDNLKGQAQTFPTVTSSMAVTMQAALLPLDATLQTHGSCL